MEKLFILFWISFVFFNFVRSNLTPGAGTDQRDVSVSRVIGNAFNINPSCLKVSNGRGDVKLNLKEGKIFGVNYTVISRVIWFILKF